MKTCNEWLKAGCMFCEYVQPGDEVDSELYYSFIGEVPPIQMLNGFQCGESSICKEGVNLHNTFVRFDCKYFYIGKLSVDYAKSVDKILSLGIWWKP